MDELVRVKDPDTGHEFSTSRVHAEAAGLTVLDKIAADAGGYALPGKHYVDLKHLTEHSTVPEIEAAAAAAGVDLGGAKHKADKLAAAAAAGLTTNPDDSLEG